MKKNKVKRDVIKCPEFTGYLDEMPQEAKEKMVEKFKKNG